MKEHFDQKIMCYELVKSFEEEDMALFVNKTCSTSKQGEPEFLYQWHCPVYCHCRMPDAGNEMVLCVACKCWFHGECEMGDFHSPHWRCKLCPDVFAGEQRKESERKKTKTKCNNYDVSQQIFSSWK